MAVRRQTYVTTPRGISVSVFSVRRILSPQFHTCKDVPSYPENHESYAGVPDTSEFEALPMCDGSLWLARKDFARRNGNFFSAPTQPNIL